MAYDLLLRGPTRVPIEEFHRIFGAIRGLHIEGDENGVAFTNANTGVYFTLNALDDALELSINFNRPSFFAREGLRTAIALCKRFEWALYDPQLEKELALNVEDIEAPLQAWREGNAMAGGWNQRSCRVDAKVAYETWLHNYWLPRTDRATAAAGVDVYVPRIWYAIVDDALLRWVGVPLGVDAMAVPAVDFLAVERTNFLGRKRFEQVLYSDAMQVLEPYRTSCGALGSTPMFSTNKAIGKLVRASHGRFSKDQVVPEDQLFEI